MTTLQLTILQLQYTDIQKWSCFVCCYSMSTPDAHSIFCTQERQLQQTSYWQVGAVCWHLVWLLITNELKCTVELLGSF